MAVRHERLRAALGSLKLRITVGSIAALICAVGLTTGLLTREAERDTVSLQRERELGEAVRAAALLTQRVVELQQALRVTAQLLDLQTLQDDAALARFLETKPVLLAMFATVFVAAVDGDIRMHADPSGVGRSPVNLAHRDYFRRTVADGVPVVSDVVAGRISAEPVIIFTYPLRNAEGVYGVFGGSFRLTRRDLLAELVETPEGGSVGPLVVISDGQGRILAHPLRERLLQPLSAEPRLHSAFLQWQAGGAALAPAGLSRRSEAPLQVCSGGDSTQACTAPLHGALRSGLSLAEPGEVVSAAGVRGADWMVWRVASEQELLAPLHTARRHALLWAAVMVMAMSVLLYGVLAWLLRPLGQLERRAAHLFDAQRDPLTGWPRAHGEIHRLSQVLCQVGAERARLEALNGEVLRKLGSVMSAAPMGIAFTRDKRFELVNAEFCQLVGRSEAQLLDQPVDLLFASPGDYRAILPCVQRAFGAGRPYLGEWRMLRANGQPFWAQLRGRLVDPASPRSGTIWTLSDVSGEVASREQLTWSATHDTLTGLANRKAFEQRLAQLFDGLPRALPAELMMIDLDRFKPVNDSHGHAAGDAMLKTVALAILANVRASDLVVRLGGDEFAVLLERCTHEVALRIGESVATAIAAIALPWGDRVLHVGASVGLATLHSDTPDIAAWLGAADAACYEAKAAGRNLVRSAPASQLLSPCVEGMRVG